MADKLTLAFTHPEIAKEFDLRKNYPCTVDTVTSGSGRNLWWLCPKGHSYQARVYNRTSGKGCPYCAGKKVLKGFNDLQTTHSNIAKEYDLKKNYPDTPDMFTAGSNRKVWWLCSKGHSYQSIIANRTRNGTNCPYCTGKTVLKGFNDLRTLYPKVAAEFDLKKNYPDTPETIKHGTPRKFWWVCPNGHSYQALVNNRVRGSGCPYCSGNKVLPNVSDLQTRYPEIAAEFDLKKNYPDTPQTIMPNAARTFWWVCPNGHSYQAAANDRVTGGNGCPYCSGYKVLKGLNDLETLHPAIAAEFDCAKNKTTPDKVNMYSPRFAWWRCKTCDTSWQAKVCSRIENYGRCPNCFPRRPNSHKRPVQCVETGKCYESITEASKQTNILVSNICSACRGVHSTADGYHWRYLDE